jgi:hypothetical protein
MVHYVTSSLAKHPRNKVKTSADVLKTVRMVLNSVIATGLPQWDIA